MRTRQEYLAAAMLLGKEWGYEQRTNCFYKVVGYFRKWGRVNEKYEYIDAITLKRVTQYGRNKRWREYTGKKDRDGASGDSDAAGI